MFNKWYLYSPKHMFCMSIYPEQHLKIVLKKSIYKLPTKNIKSMKTASNKSHQNKQTNCNYTFSNTWNYFVVQKNATLSHVYLSF